MTPNRNKVLQRREPRDTLGRKPEYKSTTTHRRLAINVSLVSMSACGVACTGQRPTNDTAISYGSYSLAAGISLGFLCLGMAEHVPAFLNIEDRLERYIKGGQDKHAKKKDFIEFDDPLVSFGLSLYSFCDAHWTDTPCILVAVSNCLLCAYVFACTLQK